MKKIYMWQPYYLFGDNAYLPYTVGALAAAAFHDPVVKENYELGGLYYLRTPEDEMVKQLDDPFLCAFACYIWNFEYNISLARKIKQNFPNCLIVFGGHQLSPHMVKEGSFVSSHSKGWQNDIDFIIYDEGEPAFTNLLRQLATVEEGDMDRFSSIDNLSFLHNGEHVFNKIQNVSQTDFPSPYTEGFFDKIIDNTPEYKFSVVLETNRGCPYTCAYCDWGGVNKGKLRIFPMERVKAELDWCARHKVEYIFCADSNFGILERDEEITDYVIDLYKKFGYPKKFRAQFAKNTNERVFRINQKLNDVGMNKGATLSFQSMDENTLKIIGRKNIKIKYFMELLSKYSLAKIPTYSEVIMALPGETFESFCKGLSELLKSGQHRSINIYPCELLTNSFMGQPEFVEKYKIKTITAPVTRIYTKPTANDIQEYSRFIVSTSTLSVEDWKRTYIFSWAVQCFHCMGLTRYFAIYLQREKNIDYDKFYLALLDYFTANSRTVGGKVLQKVLQILEKFFEHSDSDLSYHNLIFGDISWPMEEGTYLEILMDSEQFYLELKEFLKKYEIEPDMFKSLLEWQKNIIKKPFDEDHFVKLAYDFPNYFREDINVSEPPINKNVEFEIKVQKRFDNPEDFAREIVWYGGRKNDALTYKVDLKLAQ